jgi:hypothetical protein
MTTRARVHSRPRRWPVAAAFLIGCLLLAALPACGGSSPTATRYTSSAAPTSPANKPGGGMTPAATAAAAAPTTAAPGAAGRSAQATAGAGDSQSQTQNVTLPDVPKLVIKNGMLGLVVKDIDSSVNLIGSIARQYGGDVLQANNSRDGDRHVADIAIQVDSAQFDNAMRALREMPGVVERKVDKTDSKDVSEDYVDVKAQIATLEATERQLLALMDKATRMEDIMTLQREITNIRGQIDRLQGKANYYEHRSATSTITIHLDPEPKPAPAPPEPAPAPAPVPWRLSAIVARAWHASLEVLQAITTVVVSVVVFCWWLVALAAVGWLAYRLNLRRARGVPRSAPPAAPAGD